MINPFLRFIRCSQVEAELKGNTYVENLCIYGDPFSNYVIALVIPNPNAIKLLAQRLGRSEVTDDQVKDLYSDPEIVHEVLQAIISHAKKAGLHKSEIPQRIKLCPEEWTPANGLLTAGLKIRRKPIKDFYLRDIERMYQEPPPTMKLDMNGNIISGKENSKSG